MKRRGVAVEGRPTVDGRLIAGGALWWNSGPIPIMANATAEDRWGSVLIGKATDLRREDDGTITALLHIDVADDDNFVITVMDTVTVDDEPVVLKGRIVEIFRTTTGWPWAEEKA